MILCKIAQIFKVSKRCAASYMAQLCYLSERAQKRRSNVRKLGGEASACKDGQITGSLHLKDSVPPQACISRYAAWQTSLSPFKNNAGYFNLKLEMSVYQRGW